MTAWTQVRSSSVGRGSESANGLRVAAANLRKMAKLATDPTMISRLNSAADVYLDRASVQETQAAQDQRTVPNA